MLSVLAAGFVTAEKIYDVSEVTVIRTGSGFMYSYRDENDQLVVRDVPPPGYLESLTAERAKQQIVVEEPEIEPIVVDPVPPDRSYAWRDPLLLTLALLLALVSVFVLLTPRFRRLRTESPLHRVLRRAGFPVFIDIELTQPDYPATRIDCLACTPAGILVIRKLHLRGTVTGEAEQDFWLNNTRNDTLQVDNPLRKNDKDTKAVTALVGNVPVMGRVVYTGNARLPAELQSKVEKVSTFGKTLEALKTETSDQRGLAGGWRTLMRFPRANQVSVRILGATWKRWVYQHRHAVACSVLLAISLTLVAARFWLP